MSIVSVHGPATMGTGPAIFDAGKTLPTAVFQVVPNSNNAMIVTITLLQSARAAADYSWNFGANATPASQAASKGPFTVTYSVAGSKSIVLTVAAGAGTPAAGTYTATYVAATGPAK